MKLYIPGSTSKHSGHKNRHENHVSNWAIRCSYIWLDEIFYLKNQNDGMADPIYLCDKYGNVLDDRPRNVEQA